MMHELIVVLERIALIGSCALLGVIVLRIPVRHLFGPRTAYQLWALVPLAIIATLLPAPTLSLHLEPAIFPTFVSPVHAVGIASTHVDHSLQWLCLWLTGVIATASWFGMQQLRFLHNLGNLTDLHNGLLASSTIAGVPALVGALKPRIILPGDFASRYTARERKLILAHERSHLLRGDAQLNVLALGLRCLNWFNPLFHFAHKYYRFDQELSCDALVIAQFPAARRAYADAMLKTYDFAEISAPPAPLPAGCLWLSTHPLQERIRMLKKPLPGRTRTSAGSLSALLLIAFSSYSAWAAQQPTTPQSMSAADTGVMSDVVMKLTFDDRAPIELRQRVESGRLTHNTWPSADAHGATWALDYSVAIPDSATHAFEGTFSRDGILVAHPSLVIMDGQTASIRTSADGQTASVRTDGDAAKPTSASPGFQLELVITKPGVTPEAARLKQAAFQKDQQSKSSPQQGTAHPNSAPSMLNAMPSEDITFRSNNPPKYPPEAVKNLQSAKVLLKVEVDATGKPKSATVDKLTLVDSPETLASSAETKNALRDAFAKASIDAAMRWKFNPGFSNGEPSGGYVLIPVDFATCKHEKDCKPHQS